MKRKTSFEMDDVVADLKVMKINQWMEKMKDREKWRLLGRPRLTQGCSAGRKGGREEGAHYVPFGYLLHCIAIAADNNLTLCADNNHLSLFY
jgi:hypothetical protein